VRLVLLHSPLTGPVVWQNLAPLLQARGFDVLVPDYRSALSEPPYYPNVVRAIASQAGEADAVIAHSGAGALVPALAPVLRFVIAVFADALLPHPGRAWFDTISPDMNVKLHRLARDGKLPRWTAWWPDGAIAAMIGNPDLYAAFDAELIELPLGYFAEKAPQTDLPQTLRCAFLQLSAGYAHEAEDAAQRGWGVRRLALHHLAIATDSDVVADAVVDLLNVRA
jgi:hypothetical protein